MRSVLSVIVLGSALALLVPDNGAQAVNAAEGSFRQAASVQQAPLASVERDVDERSPAGTDSDAAWLLALGFIGAIMARRLRAD